ncbi:hypothetical protein D3C83_245570 [compost metagenome]
MERERPSINLSGDLARIITDYKRRENFSEKITVEINALIDPGKSALSAGKKFFKGYDKQTG